MIINSMLDNDLYKFTQQRAVLGYRQNVPVEYNFFNRRPEGKFNGKFFEAFGKAIQEMAQLKATTEELQFLAKNCNFLGDEYIQYLANYRYNPNEVTFNEGGTGSLVLRINGTWDRTILWEVPLMAMISELYFNHCETDWNRSGVVQDEKLRKKAETLKDVTAFTDFGTRRRRDYQTQDMVVRFFKHLSPNFIGTSNVHLAHKHGVKALGTMAHEWIMGISALEGLRYANRHAMRIWSDIYKGNLGTALTDTFGTDAFYRDFDGMTARLFDSVRHDSGCPFEFTDKTVAAYKKINIDPTAKSIIFSDGLDSETAVKIHEHCKGKIRSSFGIGTNFTNDYENTDGTVSKPLNMVIKLVKCNGVPVVKLSDNPSKAIGDRDALRVAKWTFFNQPLDQ